MIKIANLSRQRVKFARSWASRYKLSSAESLIANFAFLGNVLLKHMKGENKWSNSSRNFGAQVCLLQACCSDCGRRRCLERINRFFGGVKNE